MEKPKISWAFVLLFGCLEIQFVVGCGYTPWKTRPDHTCNVYVGVPEEVFKDSMPTGESRLLCCAKDHPKIEIFRKQALFCRMSGCTTTPSKTNNCPTRVLKGKAATPFDEILREKCTTEEGEAGYTSLCCPKGSMEGQLASVYGAEPNEFPHITRLRLPGGCGGTIYNKRYVLTAAHCVVDKETHRVNPVGPMEVIIGSNSGTIDDKKYLYKVEKVIPHEKYSWFHQNEVKMINRTLWDVALLKLDRDITFGPNVMALRIAEPGFEPRDYADQAIIAGWGTTDTLDSSPHLQKANFRLRNPDNCFEAYKSFEGHGYHVARYNHYKEWKDQLLCVGGVLEGNWSPTAGGGDSGGPAVCRGHDGKAILCGITSFGGHDDKCLKYNNEEYCKPSIYARVTYFNEWIKKHAGEPETNEDNVLTSYVYGEPVEKGMYDHQVRITSATTGKSCGGTLVSQDVVITAASCIAKDDGSGHAGVKVHYGLNDLSNGKAEKTFDVAKASLLQGFQRVGENVDPKTQGNRIRVTDNFYKNDLAAIKLNGKAPISANKLPGLPGNGDVFEEGREIAFPRDTKHGGKLALRDFHILDKDECQRRMTRLANGEDNMGGVSMKVSGKLLCGVEKYSGGSLCDRELGGGLICKGDDGKDVLCGVQIFRLCEWSIPNAFMDISKKSGWIKRAMM